jgi:hypothetical protein
MDIHDYGGVIHLHSTLSDGNATPGEIIHRGQKAGLDFIILTDHDTLAAREAGYEGWHDDLLLLVGYEIAPSKNHYLALGTKEVVGSEAQPQDFIDAVKLAGGLGIIAHPDHRGVEQFGLPSFAWLEWDAHGYDALGIWDLMSDWQHRARSKTVAAYNLLFPPRCLLGPEPTTLERWDKLNQERETVLPGIGECDNHGLPVRVLGAKTAILPYGKALRLVHTRLQLKNELSRDVKTAYAQIIAAIKQGNCYVAQEWWLGAKGFQFYLAQADADLLPAAVVKEWLGAEFRVTCPHKAHIRLLCNGIVIAEARGRKLEHKPTKPGVWRVEVYAVMGGRLRPWIFSNPILLK